jgi:ABC-type uncharacterized transport system substrate-binding protein
MLGHKVKTGFFMTLRRAFCSPRVALLLVFLFAPINSHSNKFDHALFILSKDTPDYKKIVNLVTSDWEKSKSYGYMILIDDQSAEIDKNLKTSDIIITLGTSAADKILAKKTAQPVINTLITQSAFKSLADKHYGNIPKALASGVNPILLDQPFERRLNLARRLIKNMTDVGVMVGPSNTNNQSFYTHSIEEINLKPKMLLIDADQNPIRQLDPVIKSSDVFIPVADSHLINVTTAKWILQLAYRYRVPVIGYSANYVAAGALASVYSSPQDVSKQTAELIDSLLTKNHKNQMYLPRYCTVKFNKTVAWHLNLEIPRDLDKNTGRCNL